MLGKTLNMALMGGLLAVLLAIPAHAQVGRGNDPDNFDEPGRDCFIRGGTLVCDENYTDCCVRERKVVWRKVNGRKVRRVILKGWKCYSGPTAERMCRRLRKR